MIANISQRVQMSADMVVKEIGPDSFKVIKCRHQKINGTYLTMSELDGHMARIKASGGLMVVVPMMAREI